MTDLDPLSNYTFIKELRAGGEGKAILYKKDDIKYVCKQRIFNSINEANAGLKEAYSLARIVNENIVKFEDIFLQSKDGVIYLCIIMEYCDHGDLLDFLIELSDNVEQDTLSDTSSHSSDISTESIESSERTSSSESNGDSKKTTPLSPNTSSSSFTTASSTTSPNSCKKRKTKCIIKMTKEFTKHVIASIGQHTSSNNSNNSNNSSQTNSSSANTSFSNLTSAGTSSSNLQNQLEGGNKRNSSSSLSYDVEETVQSNQITGEPNSNYLIEQTQLIEWMLQLCFGVQSLHKSQIIHRDLKSENIFISKSNKLKIGDFGLAIKSSVPTIKGAVGTYIYSAPEVLTNQTYDKSADIFSLGCIFYELITLKILLKNQFYIGEDLINDRFDTMKFLASFPNKYYKLGPLVLKMIDKNPTLRPSIEYIIEKLQALDSSVNINKLSTRSLESNISQTSFKGVRKQLEKKHLPECAKVLAQSFQHDPRYLTLFPANEPNRLKSLETLFTFTLNKMLKNGGTIWGYYGLDLKLQSAVIWFNPDKKKGIKFSDILVGGFRFFTKFGFKKAQIGGELFGFIDKILTSGNVEEKHWFLCSIGTVESYQSNGIGSHLVEPVLEWSDHSRVDIKTLCFSKKNFPFFNRLGFEVEKEVTTNLPKGINGAWVMKRTPKKFGSELNLVNLSASVSNTNNLF